MKMMTLRVNEKEFWLIREVMRKTSDSLQDDKLRDKSFRSPFSLPDIVDIHALCKRLDRMPWPPEAVVKSQPEILQFAEHLGLLLTEDQKEILETWERGGHMPVRLTANTPKFEGVVRGLQAVMDKFLKEKNKDASRVLTTRRPKSRSTSLKK